MSKDKSSVTYRDTHDWIRRDPMPSMRLEAMAAVIRERDKLCEHLNLDDEGAEMATRDAEALLRMGYESDEIAMMPCDDKGVGVYRFYPRSAACLRGRDRG